MQVVDIQPLTPDASTREYYRILWNGKPASACVYPHDNFGNAQFAACLDVTNVFLSSNLPVAEIFASDEKLGVIIHDDFGNIILRDVLQNSDKSKRETLLNQAITLIAQTQAATAKAFNLNSISSKLKFDEEKLLWELNFFKTHYFESLRKEKLAAEVEKALVAEFTEIACELEQRATVLTHRDFHAANLMLDSENNIKIIDHQDARIGSASYDLVSLLLDRVTELPTPDWLAEKRKFFLSERERLGLEQLNVEDYEREFRLQTIQRCLKAIGTFSFQAANRGKTNYIQYINPMFKIVLRACEDLERFPNLEMIIRREIL